MKKNILLLAIIGISMLAGAFVPKSFIYLFFEKFGYYYALFLFFVWARSLFLFLSKNDWSKYKETALVFLLSIILTISIFSISNPKFKVLSDEVNLIGVSMAMHQSKIAMLPTSGFNFEYKIPEYNYIIDKRPLIYPLFVSFVHSISGYSINNGFVVNFIFGFFTLFTFYLLSRCFFSKINSIFSVFLLSSMPGFIIWITSSGFETVNLFFIVFSLFMFAKTMLSKNSDEVGLHTELLAATLAMLSQCRYESIIFSIFFISIISIRRISSRLTFVGLISPLLFVPSLWHPRLYAGNPDINKIGHFFVQVPSLYEAFNIGSLVDNSRQNLMVFLGMDPYLGFSPIVSILAFFGILLLTRNMIKKYKSIDNIYKILYCMFISTFSILYLIQFSFYRGDLSIYTQNRFSTVYFPYIVLSSIYFIDKIKIIYSIKKETIASLILIHVFYFYSFGSQQRSTNIGLLPYEYNKILSFSKNQFNKNSNILAISDHPNLYVVTFRGSVDFRFANSNIEKINKKYAKEFDHIVFFQKISCKDDLPMEGNIISEGYKLKEISKIKLTQSVYVIAYELI